MQPDLASQPELVQFGHDPGATAPLRLWVRNEGTVGSAAATIGIYSAPPEQSGARLLGTLALPAIEAGTVLEVVGTLSLAGQPEATTGIKTLMILLDSGNVQPELNENNNRIVVGEPFGADLSGRTRVYIPLVRR
jgi:hypothetical protein